MNAERQIIGSLLIDQNRIEDMHLINSEMFTDPFLGQIFSLYEHADGKEVNGLTVELELTSDFMTPMRINQLLVDIINCHDAGISDKSSCEAIYNAYRVRKFEELIEHTRLNPQNIDATIDDFKNVLDGMRKQDEVKPKTLSELTAYRDDYFIDKHKKRFEFGFEKIDKAIGGLDDGDVIIIAARPAVGKSAFSLQMIRKFGRDGYKVGYFNLEMAEKQIYERSIASASGIDMTRIRLATSLMTRRRSLIRAMLFLPKKRM